MKITTRYLTIIFGVALAAISCGDDVNKNELTMEIFISPQIQESTNSVSNIHCATLIIEDNNHNVAFETDISDAFVQPTGGKKVKIASKDLKHFDPKATYSIVLQVQGDSTVAIGQRINPDGEAHGKEGERHHKHSHNKAELASFNKQISPPADKNSFSAGWCYLIALDVLIATYESSEGQACAIPSATLKSKRVAISA